MTRAMNSLILTRAHYRRRYGNDAPEMSVPSRFLEEVPSQLIENLGSRSPAWSTPGYTSPGSRFGASRRPAHSGDFADRHYNYEDENQEVPRSSANSLASSGKKSYGAGASGSSSKPFVASWMTAKPAVTGKELNPKVKSAKAPEAPLDAHSIDNIARFFGGKAGAGKPGSLPRPAIDLPQPKGATGLRKGQHVRHAKYGAGTILLREGDGEDAKLTVLFARHGMKKLMEKFANLQKI
jgi:DNA helicase-2/ATP-dependent DNA helicase PcrA